MNQIRVGKSNLWLVKSSGRILGPYSEKEIIEKLKTREFVVLDEVAKPFKRWTYIRDEKSFMRVVEEMRSKSNRMNDESTVDIDQTKTSTPTPSITDPIVDKSANANKDAKVDLSRANVQEAIFQSFDDVSKSTRERKPKSNDYTYDRDPLVQRKAKDAARWLWLLSGGLIFITTAYVMFTQFIAKPMQNEAKAEAKIISGNEAIDDGQYQLALKHFSDAYELRPNDSSFWLYLAVLKIQLVNQTVEGRRILEKLQGQNFNDLKRLHTGLGLAYLRANDYNEAEAQFTKALDVDSSFTPALINLGAVALYQNNHAKSSSQLQLALKDGSADGADILMLVESLLASYSKSKDESYLEEAKRYIEQYISVGTDYLAEVYVANIYVLSLLNKKSEILSKIETLIDLDPLQTSQHRHNLFIFRDRLNWKLYSQWCLKATENLEPSSHLIAAEAICLYKAGEILEASKKIENAVAQTPKDAAVQGVYAFILDEVGSFEKSKVAIDKSLSFDSDKKLQLPRVMQARFCTKVEDISCANNFWREVLIINPKSLAGLAGVAKAYFNNGSHAEARKYLNRGLDISKDYVPFLELQRDLSKAEVRSKKQ